jgi:hypothetical protein
VISGMDCRGTTVSCSFDIIIVGYIGGRKQLKFIIMTVEAAKLTLSEKLVNNAIVGSLIIPVNLLHALVIESKAMCSNMLVKY